MNPGCVHADTAKKVNVALCSRCGGWGGTELFMSVVCQNAMGMFAEVCTYVCVFICVYILSYCRIALAIVFYYKN